MDSEEKRITSAFTADRATAALLKNVLVTRNFHLFKVFRSLRPAGEAQRYLRPSATALFNMNLLSLDSFVKMAHYVRI